MSEQIEVDCWGQVAGESNNYRVKPPVTVEIDTPANGEGFTYRRFYKECPCMIQRDGVATVGDRTIVETKLGYGDLRGNGRRFADLWNGRRQCGFLVLCRVKHFRCGIVERWGLFRYDCRRRNLYGAGRDHRASCKAKNHYRYVYRYKLLNRRKPS